MGKWWTLLAVCLGTFMLLVDVTIVNVALPSIEADLGASFDDLQWVVDAYALTLAAMLLTAGTLADRLGRRRIYVIGVAVFTVASLACGLATTPLFLNLARGVQGIGGALMFACALSLLAFAYRGKDRGTAFGIWGATTGAAVAVGPLAGGALTQGIGWEAIFFVNIPFGVAVIALTLRSVAESRNEGQGRLDLPGVVLFSVALAALVLALIRGNEEGFGSAPIVALLAAAVVALLAFVIVERRSAEPMLDLSLFRVPTFVGASLAAFALSATIFALFLYITLYIQNQLDYSALEAGLRFLPTSLISFVVAPISGKFAERFGIRWFVGAGLVLVGIGLVLMSGADPSDDWTTLLPGLIVSAFGIGMVNPALATTAVGVVEPERSGMASGINSTFRQVGIATGVALWGAVFAAIVNDRAETFARAVGGRIPEGASGSFSDFISFGAYRMIGQQAVEPGRAAFLDGFDAALLSAGIFAVIAGIACAILIRPRDFVAHG